MRSSRPNGARMEGKPRIVTDERVDWPVSSSNFQIQDSAAMASCE
jgi:hypothetical protein